MHITLFPRVAALCVAAALFLLAPLSVSAQEMLRGTYHRIMASGDDFPETLEFDPRGLFTRSGSQLAAEYTYKGTFRVTSDGQRTICDVNYQSREGEGPQVETNESFYYMNTDKALLLFQLIEGKGKIQGVYLRDRYFLRWPVAGSDSALVETIRGVRYVREAKVLPDIEHATLEDFWSEGVPGTGIGQKITFTFDRPQTINALVILNGIIYQRRLFTANARFRTVEVANGTASISLEIADTPNPQLVAFPQPLEVTNTMTLTIKRVFNGTAFADTCVTRLFLLGSTP